MYVDRMPSTIIDTVLHSDQNYQIVNVAAPSPLSSHPPFSILFSWLFGLEVVVKHSDSSFRRALFARLKFILPLHTPLPRAPLLTARQYCIPAKRAALGLYFRRKIEPLAHPLARAGCGVRLRGSGWLKDGCRVGDVESTIRVLNAQVSHEKRVVLRCSIARDGKLRSANSIGARSHDQVDVLYAHIHAYRKCIKNIRDRRRSIAYKSDADRITTHRQTAPAILTMSASVEQPAIQGKALVVEQINGPFHLVTLRQESSILGDDEVLVRFLTSGIW